MFKYTLGSNKLAKLVKSNLKFKRQKFCADMFNFYKLLE